MKWIANKTFPHPVLSPENRPRDRDYVGRDFQVNLNLQIQPGSNEGRLDIEYRLSEQSLVDLIKRNKARYATEIHCRDTYLRRLKINKLEKDFVEFEKGELHQHVEISSYVVCIERVREHKSNTIHKEFGSDGFDFEPGDVLAVSSPMMYWIEPYPARLLGTIFQLKTNDSQSDNFAVNWGDDSKIQIIMNPADAEKFTGLHRNENMWPSLLASVYLSVLTQTLRLMTSEEEEHAHKKWFNVISQKMSDEGIKLSSESDFLDVAQKLLDCPVHNMLTDKEG